MIYRRERVTPHPCDARRELRLTRAVFPGISFDLVKERDPVWTGHSEEDFVQLRERAEAFLAWLEARPETWICVVTHGGFLMSVREAYLVSSLLQYIHRIYIILYIFECIRTPWAKHEPRVKFSDRPGCFYNVYAMHMSVTLLCVFSFQTHNHNLALHCTHRGGCMAQAAGPTWAPSARPSTARSRPR